MTQGIQSGMTAAGRFEPSLTHVFLPGCKCGERHPLAMKPVPADTAHCPGCGARVADPGEPVTTEAVLTGEVPKPLIARAAFAIARFLRFLARKV